MLNSTLRHTNEDYSSQLKNNQLAGSLAQDAFLFKFGLIK